MQSYIKKNYNYFLIDFIDKAFLSFYRNVINNSRRLTRIFVTLVPLMTLLVGSCKTAQLPMAYINKSFPTSIINKGSISTVSQSYSNRTSSGNRITGDSNSLLNLTQKEIGSLFGRPNFSRKDDNARVWQYKTSKCVVDFYFYEEVGSKGNNKISYVDIRFKEELIPGSSSRAKPASYKEQSNCLNGVVANRSYHKSHA